MFLPQWFRGAAATLFFFGLAATAAAKSDGPVTQGELDAIGKDGQRIGSCPLKHTDVSVDVSGFIARVTLRQQFQNPFKDKIEAIYVFPMSQDAAVDRMTMKIGDRIIEGEIKEREEARKIYDAARAAGKVASLLDQERPNIFTQAVANIAPGARIDIEISYTETLDWEDGEYKFDFPMVVGPRYMPGYPTGAPGPGTAPATDQVPDANRISPPVTPEGTRAGHDISVTVKLNAGLPIQRLDSKQHEVNVAYTAKDKSQAVIKLKDLKTIPNKDFVLAYQTASDKIEDTVLTHTDERGKFFTLVLQPPKRVRVREVVPKEIFFVIDVSGSMHGFPLDTAKKAMRLSIEGMHEKDTFNLMTFAAGTSYCFDAPVANTPENRAKALAYLESLRGGGGTEMMAAINGCLARQDKERVRVVCFMTDGYVGNDMEIIDSVKKNAGVARVFSIGIGRSVNRYLLDNMAKAGRGEVHYVLDPKEAEGAAEKFYERVRMPVLTDVAVDFGTLKVEEVYPERIPDLFSSTPVVIKGRYKEAGKGQITLRGTTGAGPFERKIDVVLPEKEPANEALAPLWARAKVADLMSGDLLAIQRGQPNPAVKETILGLGMRYRLLTQFTSFVAVEHKMVVEGGVPRKVAVPVEMPEGVSHEGVFGDAGGRQMALREQAQALRMAPGQGRLGGAYAGCRAASRIEAPLKSAEAAQPLAPQRPQADGASQSGESDSRATADRPGGTGKLSPDLARLAQQIAKDGKQAGEKFAGLRIADGRVEIRVTLSVLSEEVVKKLTALGFKEKSRAAGANVIEGTVAIEKLEELSKLAEVRRVEPVK